MNFSARFKDNVGSKVGEDFNELLRWGLLDECLATFVEPNAPLLVGNPTMLMNTF